MTLAPQIDNLKPDSSENYDDEGWKEEAHADDKAN
jgi:hypothetical protein